ncbi:MAG: hypothetical protein JF600_06460 [Xanthomonadales bacterium]|nr:hypothetical protein [Xanthomonadales bacterium]
MRRRRRPSWPARLAATAVVLALVAAVLAFSGWRWFREYRPDPARYPLRGIDVSHHQGRIDWPRVAADDVAFAYLKATEGGDYRDDAFARNWDAARAAGLAVGAYHFFTFCRPGAEQADNVLATVPAAADALPLVVDLEFGGNCGRVPAPADLRGELDAFLARVEPAQSRRVVFYVTAEFLDAYGAALPPRALWRRSLLREPEPLARWVLWQYHNRGRVDGIDGPVDLDVFFAGPEAFAAWRGAAAADARPWVARPPGP